MSQGSRPRARAAQVAGIAVSFACLYLVFRNIDLAALRTALAALQWPLLAAGLASLACGYLLRIARWAVMLRAAGATVSARDCAAPFLGSIALNNILPLRAGDIVRALVFPAALAVPRTTAGASLLIERLADLLTLLLALGLGLTLAGSALPPWLGAGVLVLAAAGFFGLTAIALFGPWLSSYASRLQAHKPHRALAIAADLLTSLSAMARPRVLAVLALYSFALWACEAGLFWALLAGLGIPATPPQALAVMALATLATLLPSSPGYVGTF
ncbi:MAG TPA: lysylphosphatidylglycerol synthase transmembrane domain-containing protein, partial [Burkholderiaceae bacterium]